VSTPEVQRVRVVLIGPESPLKQRRERFGLNGISAVILPPTIPTLTPEIYPVRELAGNRVVGDGRYAGFMTDDTDVTTSSSSLSSEGLRIICLESFVRKVSVKSLGRSSTDHTNMGI